MRLIVRNLKLFVLFAGAVVFAPSLSAATILWEENFDSAGAGTSLSAPPLSWQRQFGDMFLGASLHPGWISNAIDASTTTDAPEGQSAGTMTVALPTMPTSGVLTLSMHAWANSGSYGSIFYFSTNQGEAVGIQAWDNCCLHNVWDIYARPSFTGSASTIEWDTPSNSYRDSDVIVSLVVDYDAHEFYGMWDGVGGVTSSPRIAFSGNQAFESLMVYTDVRGGRSGGGVDVDWMRIADNTAPVPEPASAGLLAIGMAGLAAWRRWDR